MADNPQALATICERIRLNQAPTVGLSAAGITDDDCDEIAAALESNTSVEILYLDQNAITAVGAAKIAAALAHHPALTVLNLGRNSITAAAGGPIGQMLGSNTVLQQLMLDNNPFAGGCVGLAPGLQNNTALQILSMYTANLVTSDAA